MIRGFYSAIGGVLYSPYVRGVFDFESYCDLQTTIVPGWTRGLAPFAAPERFPIREGRLMTQRDPVIGNLTQDRVYRVTDDALEILSTAGEMLLSIPLQDIRKVLNHDRRVAIGVMGQKPLALDATTIEDADRLELAISPQRKAQLDADTRAATLRRAKNPWVAALLSFFIIGLGQLYNGQIGKGIAAFILAGVFAMMIGAIIGIALLPIWWILVIVDAFRSANRLVMCPNCTKTIGIEATVCPHCTRPVMPPLDFRGPVKQIGVLPNPWVRA